MSVIGQPGVKSDGPKPAHFPYPRLRKFSGYLVAIATVGVATLMRLLLDPILGEHHPFTLYFAAVAVTSWYGGFRPGLLALVLSYFGADWFFIAPRFEFNWPHSNLDEFMALMAFLFTGLAIAVTSQLARNALLKARLRQAELETQIAERRRVEVALRQAEAQLRVYATELESRVQERTAHLQETIRSLEGVCYHIAHDLRAPLRAMEGYTTILLEQQPGGLDSPARDYLQRINESSTQMDRLLHGLLDYGRLGHREFALGSVDARGPLNHMLQALEPLIRHKNAAVNVSGTWRPVLANTELLEVVFENLLSNALKFVRPDQPPSIEIRLDVEGERARFSVSDNGLGMPADMAHKAFQIFETLHPNQGFSGVGIGLALVAKAIERMNGTIEVKPNSTSGSTFHFELPLALAEEQPPGPARQQMSPAALQMPAR